MLGYRIFGDKPPGQIDPDKQNGLRTQLSLSLIIGFLSFITFCILRPRWSTLYSARRKQMQSWRAPPELPKTLFGWMPALYRISQDDILQYAGLDAYVFLNFFRMAIKYLLVTFSFALVVISPIHIALGEDLDFTPDPDKPSQLSNRTLQLGKEKPVQPAPYYWMYVVFVYIFSIFALWLITSETSKIIWVRQQYLASQATITDRTIRLSGIPKDLRSEEKIKETVEELEIGKVDSVTLCRNWKELDRLVADRAGTLRKLEEAHTVLRIREAKAMAARPLAMNENGSALQEENDDEEAVLLNGNAGGAPESKRPTIRVWHGKFSFRYKEIDAVDYFEEKLRRLDEEIESARKKEYEPTALAFVTLDSVAACQMAVQASLDPSPRVLLAHPSPAPQDVVWRNTYLSRNSRLIRAWSISIFIFLLTIFWILPVSALARLVNVQALTDNFPALGKILAQSTVLSELVTTGVPTLVITILNISVPYFYEFLSNYQGMVSQSDVDLSVISKNFNFTFFNVFVVFTLVGTAERTFWDIGGELKDITKVAQSLALFFQRWTKFYVNLIILQGLGLFPLRLLEFGSVFLYPFGLLGAKTPRDHSELDKPAVFTYGFYLPQSLLIFLLCIFYSVFPAGYLVLGFGLVYFILGYYTYKYQLLYAMDHSQHSTGRAWPMICYRVMIGLLFFQTAMAGYLALKQAFTRALLIVPLIFGTIWYSYYYARSYEPLTKFIALRGIHQGLRANSAEHVPDVHIPEDTLDETRERAAKFVNPSLYASLEKVWLDDPLDEGTEPDDTLPGPNTPPQSRGTDFAGARGRREGTPSSTLSNPWADEV